jgi:glycosyltransferase involved in cell wall biosynthesis
VSQVRSSTVAVVIPTTGRDTLSRALNSVRTQTSAPAEIVVVLDNPSALDRVQRMMLSGERLVVTRGHVGGALARNMGVDQANSEYVAFLDDDDWWEPEKTEIQLRALKESSSQWAYSYSRFVDGDRVRILPRNDVGGGESIASYLVSRRRLRHGDGYIQSSSLLIERRLARAVRWDNELKKHQDWDLVVRLDSTTQDHGCCCRTPLVNVFKQQKGRGSVSSSRDWRHSLPWYENHCRSLDARSRGDFVATQILRSALAQGDWAEFVGPSVNSQPIVHISLPQWSEVRDCLNLRERNWLVFEQ